MIQCLRCMVELWFDACVQTLLPSRVAVEIIGPAAEICSHLDDSDREAQMMIATECPA